MCGLQIRLCYPLLKAEGYRFGVVRPAVRPAVHPSVTNLLGLYLNDYYRFEQEISGVYRPHWGEVHCTRTITLHFLILEVLPFVIFKASALGARGLGFNSRFLQGFLCWFFRFVVVAVMLCFYFCFQKHINRHKILQFILQC